MTLPFTLGSDTWPGVAKVTEEAGELLQLLGKLQACGGADVHFDGTAMRARITEEVADLGAALLFMAEKNGLDMDLIDDRSQSKFEQYESWHKTS
jgi:NTP pyrophosphatase (non-canonical NTP hydrolase)